MAQAKTTKPTAFVKNTASRLALKGNVAKSSTVRKNTAKRATTKKPVRSKRRPLRRNSAGSATAGLLAAFGGALVINGFDMVINRFLPNTSGMIRTIAKFGGGFLVGMYGSKVPLIRGFAPTISAALYLAGALDLVSTYLMPKLTDLLDSGLSTVSNAISPAQVVAATTVQDKTSGELGRAYTLSNGQSFEVYGGNQSPSWQGGFAY